MTSNPRANPRANAILEAIRSNPQLPGLAANIGRIVAIADSENESIQELRDVILADVHLTQRILAIANSVGYRLNSGSGVSTVSKAIVVIGFEQVKVIALGMMFVDQIPDLERAAAMKAELIRALQASLLAREMSRQLAPDDKEKAGIAALLGNVARLLLVMIDFPRFVEIARRVESGITEAAASSEVLGMPVEALTKEVLTLWGIPDALVALSTGTSVPVEPKLRRLGRMVRLATTTAQHLGHPEGPERDVLIGEVRGECLAESGVTAEVFDRWMLAADAQLRPVRALFQAAIPGPARIDSGFPDGTVIDTAAPVAGRLDAVGKPANSRDLILSRLQDVTDLIAQGQGLTATLRTALECLHTGFGFTRSILLLREAGTPRIHARLWCGDVTKAQASRLQIDIGAPGDLFAEAVRRGSDLQIQNARDPKITARLPPYFTAAFPRTASFIVLPIVSGDSPIACILVGRDVPEMGPISSEDVSLLRAVRGQIILAMKTVR
ncbi:MAG TPA: HDOD domain-containing protein [Steroidobacteraceae bacterium]|nr:HDOD domain-containing protein [Steroidobacteraceae bacterium]